MKHLLLILLLVFAVNHMHSQKIETKFTNYFPLDADVFIGIDEFENLYFIKNNTFFKKSAQGTFNYTNPSLGKITSVDVHNPFKIILFYRDYNSAIVLDNKLNELTDKIDFTGNTLFNNVQLVSHSSENNLWLFADDNKLHLYNFQNSSEKIQTQPITFYQSDFIPKSLKSTYKNAWLLGNTGVIQINEYGNFINFFKTDGIDFISAHLKGFIFVKDASFFYVVNNDVVPVLIELDHLVVNIYINSSSINIFDGENVYRYIIL
jgi:hypothetical protein